MSRLPFELLLALRYLRPKRTFVSVITFISVLGVAVGVAVLVIVISVMSGFDQQMRDTILGINAHLEIQDVDSTMTNYDAVMKIISSNANVTAVAPFVRGQVPLRTEPAQGQPLSAAPMLRGVDPQLETNVSIIPSRIVEGRFDLSGYGVVIGKTFAENMDLAVGDRVNIYSWKDIERLEKNRGKDVEETALPDEYEVRGIFDVGYYDFNALMIVVSLENAQELYNIDDSVHGLRVMIRDPYNAPEVKTQLELATK